MICRRCRSADWPACFLEGPVLWIIGGVTGFPIFILVVSAPWVFVGGLMEVFKSSTWTLIYRELRALEGVETGIEAEMESEERAESDAPDLE